MQMDKRTRLPQFHIKLHAVFFEVNKFRQRCDESRLHTVQEVPLLHTANPLRLLCITELITAQFQEVDPEMEAKVVTNLLYESVLQTLLAASA
jgi:hypothetical protein